MTEPRPSVAELTESLRKILPPNLQDQAESLAQIVVDTMSGAISTAESSQRLSANPELAAALSRLSGTGVTSSDSVIRFGEGNQVGDVRIGDIAGGDAIKLTINIHQPPVDSRNRAAMLNKVRTFWIDGLLRQYNLGAQDTLRPNISIQRPGSLVLEPLTLGTRLIDLFDRAGRALLILGSPGAGKTTLLLQLAEQLIERAEQLALSPIPVIVNLSSWAIRRLPITEWLIDELRLRYDVPGDIARNWVESDAILPLLDGLDEVAAEARSDCVVQINRFRHDHYVPIVVTSRAAEYLAPAESLNIGTAIVLQPPTPAQIKTYFATNVPQLSDLGDLVLGDASLREFVSSPLTVSMIANVAHNISPERLRQANSSGELRRLVFEMYIELLLHNGWPGKARTTARRLLGWLARTMLGRGETFFFIEHMQYDMLPSARARLMYVLAVLLVRSVLIGLAMVLFTPPIVVALAELGGPALLYSLLPLWFLLLIVSGFPEVFLTGLTRIRNRGRPAGQAIQPLARFTTIRLIERLALSWHEARPAVLSGMLAAGLTGLGYTAVLTPSFGQGGVIMSLLIGLTVGIAIGVLVLVTRVRAGVMAVRSRPNDGIRRSALNAFWIGLPVGACFGLASGMVVALSTTPAIALQIALQLALLAGLFSGLAFGGDAVFKHTLLRAMLIIEGSLPLNLAGFLEHAVTSGIMRRVGGGFLFSHRMLMEEFAREYEERTPEPATLSTRQGTLWDALGELPPTITVSAGAAKTLEKWQRATSVQLLGAASSGTGATVTDADRANTLNEIAAQLDDTNLAVGLAAGMLREWKRPDGPEQFLARMKAPDLLGRPELTVRGRGLDGASVLRVTYVLRALAVMYRELRVDRHEDRLLGELLSYAAWLQPDVPIETSFLATALPLVQGEGNGPDRDRPVTPTAELEPILARAANLGLLSVLEDGRPCLPQLLAELLQFFAGNAVRDEVAQVALSLADTVELSTAQLAYLAQQADSEAREYAAVLLSALGRRERRESNLEGAIAAYRRALSVRERQVDSADLQAISQIELAEALRAADEPRSAVALYERAHVTLERVRGAFDPETLNALAGQGAAYADLAQYERAQALYRNALDSLPPNYALPSRARLLHQLADVLRSERNYVEAATLYRQALALRDQLFEGEHPDRVASAFGLALTLQDLNQFAEARELIDRVKAVLPWCDPQVTPAGELVLFASALLAFEMRQIERARAEISAGQTIIVENLSPESAQVGRKLSTIYNRLLDVAEQPSRREAGAALNRLRAEADQLARRLGELDPLARTRLRPLLALFSEIVAREQDRVDTVTITRRVVSPYSLSRPVSGKLLVGREDIFEKISALWAGKEQRDSLLIYGHKRMGKTSIAKSITSRCDLGTTTDSLYITVESLERTSEASFYYSFAAHIQQEYADQIPEPRLTDYAPGEARISFNRFLGQLGRALKGRSLVLILDEFELLFTDLEKLAGTPDDENLATGVIEYLRGQTQTYLWLTFALVGPSDVEDLRHRFRATLTSLQPIHVGFLDRGQVAEVLANPAFADNFPLIYDQPSIALVERLTRGQPFLVQAIGQELVMRYNRIVFAERRPRSHEFNVEDVMSVVESESFFQTASPYFIGIWSQAEIGFKGETAILRALVPYEDGLPPAEVARLTQLSQGELERAAAALDRHDTIVERPDGRICYAVPLMRIWVERTQLRTGRGGEQKHNNKEQFT